MLLLVFATCLLVAATPRSENYDDPFVLGRGVEILRDRTWYLDALDAPELLRRAAQELEYEVPWLFVESDDAGGVRLARPDGTELGVVSAPDVARLPDALQRMRILVVESGLPLPEDLRLDVTLLEGLTEGFDRHTDLIQDKQKNAFQRSQGVYDSIGTTLRRVDGQLRIREVVEYGPADAAGLRKGDLILEIDGVSTVGMTTSEAEDRLEGKRGTPVDLEIQRRQEVFEVTCTRGPIRARNGSIRRLDSGFVYIDLDGFDRQTSEWMAPALYAHERDGSLHRGIILDLRDNRGGLSSATDYVIDQFLHRGLTMGTRKRDFATSGYKTYKSRASRSGFDPRSPMVVLVNDDSASGAELLAGALQYRDRAILVGSSTYGKGSGWRVWPIQSDLALRVTEYRHWLPGRVYFDDTGLTPDIQVSRIELDRRGMERFSEEESHPWNLDWVDEEEGWREEELPEEDRDPALALAERILEASEGWKRKDVLDAATAEVERFQAAEWERLTEALAVHDIDWSPPEPGAAPPTGLEIEPEPRYTFQSGEDNDFTLRVHNRGEEPAWRVQIHVEAEYSRWDRLIVPVGHLAPGETREVRGGLYQPTRSGTRSEQVALRLEAANLSEGPTVHTDFTAVPTPGSPWAIHLDESALQDRRHVRVSVENRSEQELRDIEVHVRSTDPEMARLDAAEFELSALAPGERYELPIGLVLSPDHTGTTVPIRIELEADDHRDGVFDGLELPPGGTAVTAHPRTTAVVPGLAPSGRSVDFNLKVEDEGELKHVVVFFNRDKVAYEPGDGSTLELTVPLVYEPGHNRIRFIATDRDGRTVRATCHTWGTGDSTEENQEDAPKES